MYDGVGTARALVDTAGAVTDSYTLDAFGVALGSSGSTTNPHRFGGAWGYIADTPGSGLLQLGARFYWPELGRFITQDPIGDGMNWYAYGGDNPVRYIDADGESPLLAAAVVAAAGGGVYGGVSSALSGGDWRQGAAKGAIVAGVIVATAGLAGPAIAAAAGGGVVGGILVGGVSSVAGDLAGQGYGMATGQQCGFNSWELGGAALLGGLSGGIVLRPSTAAMQPVTSWASEGVAPDLAPGRWVMTGGGSYRNYAFSGVRQYGYPRGNYTRPAALPGSQLSYPSGLDWWKGLIGQRVIH